MSDFDQVPSQAITAAAEAIAAQRRHLWDVDFCEVQALAAAVLEAAAPHLAAAERERCARLAEQHNARYIPGCADPACPGTHAHMVTAPFAALLRDSTETALIG